MIPLTRKTRLKQLSSYLPSTHHYVYGAKGINGRLTLRQLDALKAQNPKVFTDAYYAKAKKFLGQPCIDCSGLVCAIWCILDIGSYQIADLPKNKPSEYEYVPLSRNDLKWGDVLWKTGHVGVYLGDSKVLEARGIDAGVGVFDFTSQPWKKAIRKKSLHQYAYTGWIADEISEDQYAWWYAYGESKGEYYKNMVCDPDEKGALYEFDDNGYAEKYHE